MSKKIIARSFLSILLIVSISLVNIHTVLADDTTPPTPTAEVTEEPTEQPTQPADESVLPVATETPTVEGTPEVSEQAPLEGDPNASGPFSQIPENTEVVVLDENGNPLPLVTSEALDIILETDPMWCPAGVLPGGPGCTTNYASITLLINNMISNTNAYDQAGVIYFTSNPGASFSLTTGSLGTADFTQLSDNNLTLQGGWNGQNGANANFNGQTNFGTNALTIGTSSNPWIGNITLTNFSFNGVSSTDAVTVYTTNGNIVLNNVDVSQQSGDNYTANLVSNNGNITVQNGSSFDGDNTGGDTNQGFNASTTTGTITITGTAANPITFTDAEGSGTGTNYNGATLSAPTVNLTRVTADGNDLNGIQINNANSVTLNNVVATNNGTQVTGPNLGSGVFVDGTGVTVVNITGGTFSNNERYPIEISNGSYTITNPAPTRNGNGESNNIIVDNTPPLVTPATSCSVPGSNGWCRGTITINWTVSDAQSAVNSTGCQTTTHSTNTTVAGTTFTCSATSTGGTTNNSVTVYRDAIAPVATASKLPAANGNGWNNTDVTVTFTGTDANSGIASCTSPVIVTTEGANQPISGTCTDVAGNSDSDNTTVSIDKTAPTVNANLIPAPNANGWNDSGVFIIFSGTDSGSGIPFLGCTPTFSNVASEGAGQTRTGTCTDRAGNVGTQIITLNIDLTNPVATATKSPAPNAFGWNNTDVVVTFSGTDTVSGIASCTLPATVSAEGANQSRSGTCTDLAGRGSNTATANNINIDKTAPVITFVSRTPANGNGWNNGDVTVTWSCTDALSGVIAGTVTQTVSTEGANQSATGTCQDRAGNTSSNTVSGINIDSTNPTLTLPADMTVEATSASGADVNYTASATDNLTVSLAVSCSQASGTTFSLGTTSVNCTTTDDAGNSANGSFNVTVQDTTAPTLNLPADMTLEATGPTGATVTYSASASDLVDASVSLTCSPLSGSVFGLGVTTVNCTGVDDYNNTANGSFTVTVQDTTAPVIAAHPDLTLEATSAAGATATYTSPATSDVVDGTGTANCSPLSGSTFAIGTATVTCNATDSQGNTAIPTTFTIMVQDTTAPLLSLPADMTLEATSAAGATGTYSASATDVVDGSLPVSCSPASGSTFAISTTTVNCSATDSHSNTANGSFTITVQDTTAPVIASHSNMTLEATSASGANVLYSSPTTSDAVDGTGTATCSPVSGSTFAIGTTTVTCNATDNHGNTATPTTFTITIQDTTAPALNLPANMTLEATSAAGATGTYSASASDIVDGSLPVSCSPVSGSTFGIGTTTVNCSATDSHSNTANGSFTVTVRDTTAPVIASHSNMTLEAASAAGTTVPYTNPTTSDAVDGIGTATCSPVSGSIFAIGTTTVTCNATDSHGNTATPTTFTITVQDTTAPVLSLPANMTLEATSAAGATGTYSASASDIVDGSLPVSCSPVSGSTFAIGTTTVNCSAADSHSNTANGSFTVTVRDTTAPVIAAHSNMTVEATSASGATVTYVSPATTDAVDGVGTATCSPVSNSTFAIGTTTVTCVATDNHGNSAIPTTFTITVQDTTAPALNLPLDMILEATSAAGATGTYSASATDLVDGSVSISCSPVSGSTFAIGTTTVNCASTDSRNNTANGSFTITVQDTTAPVIASHSNMTAEATSAAGATVPYTNPTTSDAVDGVGTSTCSPVSGSTFAIGTTTITCIATDSHGNNATPTTFTITVQDTTAPVLNLPANMTLEATSAAGATGTYSASASDVVDGGLPVSCSPVSGSTFAFGTTTVNCSATDSQNNTTTGSFTVTVQDTTAPVIAPHGNLKFNIFDLSTTKKVDFTLPITTDAVDGLGTATCTPAPNSTFKAGDTLIKCTAVDSHGNVATPTTFVVSLNYVDLGNNDVIIPVTGGETIDLDCNSEVMLNGIKVIFYNLCDQQAVLTGVSADNLPGKLPEGFTFVSGLNVSVLDDDKALDQLPVNTGIEADFPTGNAGQYAVLFWDGSKWVEVTQSLSEADLAKALGNDTSDELYKLVSSTTGVFKTLTTEKTGIFVLVKK